MAITESTVLDRVVVGCNCDGMKVTTVTPYNGTTPATGAESIPSYTKDADKIAQLDIMQDAIDAGTAALWYFDNPTWIAYADLEDEHGLIHAMHRMRPAGASATDGFRVLPNIVKNTEYEEGRRHRPARHLHAKFGTISAKRKPDGDTFDYPLENWNARLIPGTQISVELNLTADDNVTDINADDNVIGMLAWLESLRTSGSTRSATTSRISMIWPTAASISLPWAPDRPRSTSKSSP